MYMFVYVRCEVGTSHLAKIKWPQKTQIRHPEKSTFADKSGFFWALFLGDFVVCVALQVFRLFAALLVCVVIRGRSSALCMWPQIEVRHPGCLRFLKGGGVLGTPFGYFNLMSPRLENLFRASKMAILSAKCVISVILQLRG